LFNKWHDDRIFKIGFNNYINKKNINTNEIDLLIDTKIYKYGVENIVLNTDKKKRSTKISFLSDVEKFIYSVVSVPINSNIKKKYKKRRTKN
jgi:hypothetical protein